MWLLSTCKSSSFIWLEKDCVPWVIDGKDIWYKVFVWIFTISELISFVRIVRLSVLIVVVGRVNDIVSISTLFWVESFDGGDIVFKFV